MAKARVEQDALGEVNVPDDVLYQAQTQRAVDNFSISGERVHQEIILAMMSIKAAAAGGNSQLGELNPEVAGAIIKATELAISLDFNKHFPVDVYQTGSGTSTNMNVNEVLATLASKELGRSVHPNDDVNHGQSSNDVFPSALQVAFVRKLKSVLFPVLDALINQLEILADQYQDVSKVGRTHLMDAMPVTLGSEFHCWAEQTRQAYQEVWAALEQLLFLPVGGTAVGSGINAHPDLAELICQALSDEEATISAEEGITSKEHGTKWSRHVCPSTNMSGQLPAMRLSHGLKSFAIVLLKIANDLRWMNSGPLAGLNEIQLPTLQPGSSIMPGKVNPVILESIAMVATRVVANDVCITQAAGSGNFQLNVMLPLIGQTLMQTIELLTSAGKSLTLKVLNGISVNEEHLRQNLESHPVLVTVLNPYIGYALASKIAKEVIATGEPVIEVALKQTGMEREELEAILDTGKMTGRLKPNRVKPSQAKSSQIKDSYITQRFPDTDQ